MSHALRNITESTARVFHLSHRRSPSHKIDGSVVVIDPSRGFLSVALLEQGTNEGVETATYRWPKADQWGVPTFEGFLCSRTAGWITGKLLGDPVEEFHPGWAGAFISEHVIAVLQEHLSKKSDPRQVDWVKVLEE